MEQVCKKSLELAHYSYVALAKSSFVLLQEAYQEGRIICRGKYVLVHFDYRNENSHHIALEVRVRLEKHLATAKPQV